jgi:hypothetical protein
MTRPAQTQKILKNKQKDSEALPSLFDRIKKAAKKDVIARSFIGDPAKANGLCGERKSQVTVGIFRFAGNIKL